MDRKFDDSWTNQALKVLERAEERYGGRARWQRLRRIRLVPERIWGAIPALKGIGRTFPLASAFEIAPHERGTRFESYPEPAYAGVFQDGAVRLETTDGRIAVASADHRRTFRGFAKHRRWSPLDGLYFFGYALWHYHSLPFTLALGRVLGVHEYRTAGERLDVLDLQLPPDMPTHCRRQSFYFDANGLLRRHDYHSEVLGALARGAHSWLDYREVDGFPIAMQRRVVCRIGRFATPFVVLKARMLEASIERA